MSILFTCRKSPQILWSSSHQKEFFISPPLEYELSHKTFLGQWETSKRNVSGSLKSILFHHHVNELLEDERHVGITPADIKPSDTWEKNYPHIYSLPNGRNECEAIRDQLAFSWSAIWLRLDKWAQESVAGLPSWA